MKVHFLSILLIALCIACSDQEEKKKESKDYQNNSKSELSKAYEILRGEERRDSIIVDTVIHIQKGPYTYYHNRLDIAVAEVSEVPYVFHLYNYADSMEGFQYEKRTVFEDIIRRELYLSEESYAGIVCLQGNDTVFHRVLRKKDFVDIMGAEFVTKAQSFSTELLTYNPHFQSFIFRVQYNVPETCWTVFSILLLNEEGEITQHFVSNFYVDISSDQKSILTDYHLLLAPNKLLDLSKKKSIIRSLRLTDQTFLVFTDRTKHNPNNAFLFNNQLDTIQRFEYAGYYQTIDYYIPHKKSDDQMFLLDETLEQLISIDLMTNEIKQYPYFTMTADSTIRNNPSTIEIKSDIDDIFFLLNEDKLSFYKP